MICVAYVASVRDLQPIAGCRRNETKSVTADIHVGNSLLDSWHVAGNAFAAGAASLVMRVLFERRREGSIRRVRAMAVKANGIGRFSQESIVTCAVSVVARKAGNAVSVHQA